MKKEKGNAKKIIALSCAIMMGTSILAGCAASEKSSSNDNTTSKSEGTSGDTKAEVQTVAPYKLSIMAPFASDEDDKKPRRQMYYQKIQDYTNTEIEWIFYPETLYWDKVPLTLATGDLPSIMVANRTPEIGSAGDQGDIWEVGPYIDEFPNLSTIPEAVRENVSYNGHMYGVPRSRDLGRNGVGYRLDWLENLGLDQPKTIDDFYNMLAAFTKNDPDGNGQNDTIGLAVTSYPGPWKNMQVWFGAPNEWGVRDGKLVPAHMTPEYDEALKFFRQLYSEGLVNQDFDTYDPAKWDDMLRGGIAGASVDVVDRFRRNQGYFDSNGIPAKTMIAGGFNVEGQELKLLPTSGYSGMLVISKSKVKTEEELKQALGFLDKINDAEMRNLIEWGVKDEDWYVNDEGYEVRYTSEEKPDTVGVNARKGFNQIIAYYSRQAEMDKLIQGEPMDEVRQMEAEVKKANIPYVVPNYGASYFSETMSTYGADLTTIMDEARVDYIKGVIDDVGLKAAKDQWLKSGGQKVIDEFNELYNQ